MTEPRKYPNVLFEFVNLEDAIEERGTVIARDSEMVIDIPIDGRPTYVIVGAGQEAFYEGRNKAIGGDVPTVHARWTKFGPTFAGRWVEDGVEYLFSFRLPKPER